MGVPRLISVLREQGTYADIFQRSVPPEVDALLLDMNGILHSTAQEFFGYGKPEYINPEIWEELEKMSEDARLELYFANVGLRILSILDNVNPKQALAMAVDGPAPIGKQKQQQRRRYKATIPPPPLPPKPWEKPLPTPPRKYFDSNAITPGTKLMMALDEFLQRWIVQNRASLPPLTYYSSHREPGEGEHKLMQLIRDNKIPGNTCVVYGLDADLLMLSMLAFIPGMILEREDVSDIIDVENFRHALQRQFPSKKKRVVHDYIVLMMFLGNDFLPKQGGFTDMKLAMDTLLGAYDRLDEPLTDEKGIRWPSLKKLIETLASVEPGFYALQLKENFLYPSPLLEAATKTVRQGSQYEKQFNFDVFRELWYANELFARGPAGQKEAFKKLNDDQEPFPVTDEQIGEMVESYLQTIAWVDTYYNLGTDAVNPQLFYRYNHAPLLVDLANWKGWDGLMKGEKPWLNHGEKTFGIWEQLLSVLPKKSIYLLPEPIQPLMGDQSPIADTFPVDFDIERFNVNTEEQAIPILPPIEVERMLDVVDRFRQHYLETGGAAAAEEVAKYEPAETLLFSMNLEERREYDAKTLERNKKLVAEAFRRAGDFSLGRERAPRSPRGRGGYPRGGGRGRGYSGGRGAYAGDREPGHPSEREERHVPRARGFVPRGRGAEERVQQWQTRAPLM